MNEIVNQHNDLIDLPLRNFSASEIDILHALCYKCQNEGTKEIVLNFADLKKLSDYKAKDESQFYRAIESMGDKLFSLNFRVGSEREYQKFVLFPTFKVSEKEQAVTVSVNEKFAYLLNELSGNYTPLELQESSSLRSAYSKGIYKQLRKFRSTGKWVVSIETLREYLDIPKGFSISKIDARVIEVALEELKPIFKGLRCEKKYKKIGKGRPRVTGYEFTFQIEKQEKNRKLTVDEIAKFNNWKKTKLCCPNCRERIYKKEMSNEHGNYYLYGHPDFRTGKCDWTTTNATDCLTVDRVENEKMIDELSKNITDKERQENKNRLSQMLSKMFK